MVKIFKLILIHKIYMFLHNSMNVFNALNFALENCWGGKFYLMNIYHNFKNTFVVLKNKVHMFIIENVKNKKSS